MGEMGTSYGYTGEMEDDNGLVYLRARYYNHDTGTFISQDPVEGDIRDPMSLNRYAYAHGNPINRTDPSGMIDERPWDGCSPSQVVEDPCRHCIGLEHVFCTLGITGPCAPPVPEPQQTPATPGAVPITEIFVPPIVTNTPYPTNTSWPTVPPATSTAIPTNTIQPSPTTVSSQLRLPINGAILTPYGCNWINSNNSPLRSRDVNPRTLDNQGRPVALGGVPVPVYAPVPQAEVMIVDDNAGPNGNFVAIRVHTQYVPHLGLGDGYLYIGYSHLSEIDVSAGNGRPPFPTVSGSIGQTGQTGASNIHLDLMAFFVSSESSLAPEPWRTVSGEETNLHENINAFFRLAGIGNFARFFNSVEVDPLNIWPEMYAETVCGSS